jgi:cell division protein FtsZ
VLINITGGSDMTLFEVDEAANRIKEEVDPDANIIVGSTLDESLQGEMRVSVVATGIEMQASAMSGAGAETPASKPSTLSMPSFRLRPLPAKPATGAGVPLKAASTAVASAAEAPGRRAAEPRGSSIDQPRHQAGSADASGWPKSEPAEAGAIKAKERSGTEPGFWHPPLPPQERFQEWGKLRAPVRDAERAPSLFERVTATFRNKEREGTPAAATDRVEGREPALATAEEDTYDIPAFLRR